MSDDSNWLARVEEFWAAFDEKDPAGMIAKMRALVEERGTEDPLALAEWGGVHDALGLEEEAVALIVARSLEDSTPPTNTR